MRRKPMPVHWRVVVEGLRQEKTDQMRWPILSPWGRPVRGAELTHRLSWP
jgi:hypothetical protein